MPNIIDNFNGAEFANMVLGQSGFNYIADDKTHLAGPVPSFEITRLQKHPSSSVVRVYGTPNVNVPNSLFIANQDDVILSLPGLEEPGSETIAGLQDVTYSNTTYLNTNLQWPVTDPLVIDLYPDGEVWTASYIEGEGYLFYTHPDVDEWPIFMVIDTVIGSTDIVLKDLFGTTLTIPQADIVALIGSSFPGRWISIAVDDHKSIAYRG